MTPKRKLIEVALPLEAINRESARGEVDPPRAPGSSTGGGPSGQEIAIPLEAQRLGLDVRASDLNPVAVLIAKALVELPPRFAGRPPVHPDAEIRSGAGWTGGRGLAEDVRRYGAWMREEARADRPPVSRRDAARRDNGARHRLVVGADGEVPESGVRGDDAARVDVQAGDEAWERALVEAGGGPRLAVRDLWGEYDGAFGAGDQGRPWVAFRCLVCGAVTMEDHARSEGRAGRMGQQLVAIVADADADADAGRRRAYLEATRTDAALAATAVPSWGPEELVTEPSHDVDRLPMYGMPRWRDAYTPRQLVAPTTLTDLVALARERVSADGGAREYADAVATYLASVVSRMTDYSSTITTWASNAQMSALAMAREAVALPAQSIAALGGGAAPSAR